MHIPLSQPDITDEEREAVLEVLKSNDDLLKKAGDAAFVAGILLIIWKLSQFVAKILFFIISAPLALIIHLINKKGGFKREYHNLTKDIDGNVFLKILSVLCVPFGIVALMGVIIVFFALIFGIFYIIIMMISG